jgi:hypothetical protein
MKSNTYRINQSQINIQNPDEKQGLRNLIECGA